MGDQSLHKVMFFGSPFWPPKVPLGLPGPRCGVGAPKCGVGAPKMGSRVKNIKVAYRKTMQNPLVVAPNGAICYKLWPKTILGWGHKFWGPHPRIRIWLYCNLQHMAPFGALTGGFCMVFRYATLIFLPPDPIFGAPTPHLGPGRPGAPFGPKKGAEKHNFVEGLVLQEVSELF